MTPVAERRTADTLTSTREGPPDSTLPQSPELERAVLAALEHVPDLGTAPARVEARDFASEGHRTILRAIEALHVQRRRADLPQLADTLQQNGDLVDVEGQA